MFLWINYKRKKMEREMAELTERNKPKRVCPETAVKKRASLVASLKPKREDT